MSARKNSSSMWHHFTKGDYGKAECNYCHVIFSYVSTTTNLKSHLMRRHEEAYKILTSSDEPESKVQRQQQDSDAKARCGLNRSSPATSASDVASQIISPRNYNAKKKHIDLDVLDIIVDGFHPFSLVEERAFKKLIRRIPDYKLPNKETMSGSIFEELYSKTERAIKDQVVKEVTTICITMDSWRTRMNETYIAISGHYINSDIQFKALLLGCCQFSDDPTPESIAKEVNKLIRKYDLEAKVNCVVSDNNPSVETAIQHFFEWNHLNCYGHALNSVVNDALKVFETDIEQVKQVVGHIKRSCLNLEKTEETLSEKLFQPIDTRWSSTYHMLTTFVEFEESVKSACAHLGKNGLVFRADKWSTISQVCQVLKPFEEITKVMSNEKYLAGSSVIVVTRCLRESCNKMLTKDSLTPAAQCVIKTLKDGLDQRFGDIEQNEVLALCTFMDPRFKMQSFSDKDWAIRTKETVQKLLTIEQTLEVDNTLRAVKEENDEFSAWTIFDEIVGQTATQKSPLSKAVQEIDKFLADEMLPRKNREGELNCPLKWWREHQQIYPILAKLFIEKCNIVATSVPCERMFSKTGNILAERRSVLTVDDVEKIMFLNVNLPEDRFKA